jgi:hypothetical protein
VPLGHQRYVAFTSGALPLGNDKVFVISEWIRFLDFIINASAHAPPSWLSNTLSVFGIIDSTMNRSADQSSGRSDASHQPDNK